MTDKPLAIAVSTPAPPDDDGPWNTVLLALGRIAGVDLVPGWPATAQPAGRAGAIHTPVTFRPFDLEGQPGTATTAADLSLALATAISATVAALTDRPAIEAFVPNRQRYGGRSVVVRAAGLPVVVAGSWIKGRGVYALVVEAAYVQHIVLPTVGETLAIAAHN